MIFALLFSAVCGFVAPDGIVAPEGVDVKVTDDGAVEVLATNGVDEVSLLWKSPVSPGSLVLRDDWERTYSEAGWMTASNAPGSAWYVMIDRGGVYDGWGVATQPNAFAFWTVSEKGIVLTLDLRAGGRPVKPGKRVIEAVRLVMRKGRRGESAYEAGRAFCKAMCREVRLVKEPVYGYNDWYCAYGKNTATNFLRDAGFVCSLAEGLENRPYVVMDDGWQKNSPPAIKHLNQGASGWGPWEEAGSSFGMKMKPFAAAVTKLGAKPGLWYRPFRAWEEVPERLRLKADRRFFDPSCPELREMVVADMKRFRDWGMKLVKVDYLTMDVVGGASFVDYVGSRLVPAERVWRDESRTTMEVLKDLYEAMREAAGDDVVIIGCNAINHLAAGLFELQRTGGDTSGWKWSQTRDMGVNSLSARSIQDGIFFAVDADCVGLAEAGAVPWEKNRQWLELVSRSGTPLFVSWKRELATPEVSAALKKAFSLASRRRATAEPLDWQRTALPRKWRFADGVSEFDWGEPEKTSPGFRGELRAGEFLPDAPETFVLEDRYGLTGPIAGIHTNLDLFIGESGRPLVLGRGKVAGRESYRVDVADDKVELTAEDDEGMRRALCYFVDRVYARDLRSVTRRPWLRDRICRSFVGPLGTPPQDRDDLADDVERYPPSYLDRLAARGFNGIWIPAGIGDFAKSEDGERSRRIAKLRELRDRSALYGIKVWLQFKTEGDAGASSCVMCRDQSAEADRIEAVAKDVFKEVPGLGGAIVFAGAESSGAYLVSARSPAEKRKVAVDCSHESAIASYIAAPYRLYRKYRKMKEAGITGVVQCCGYGACPGSVDSAAGELAYEEFADDERSFVERLAAPFWEERAEDFARAVESTLRGAATDDSLQALDRSLDVRAWWRRRDIIALRVLLLQAESSRNIAAFRRYWADASRDGVSGEAALALVGRMRALLVRQRDLGREMARLAYSDSRVGFCPVKDDYLFRARRLRRIVAELAWGELRLEEIAAELRCGGRWPDGPAPDLSGWSVL